MKAFQLFLVALDKLAHPVLPNRGIDDLLSEISDNSTGRWDSPVGKLVDMPN